MLIYISLIFTYSIFVAISVYFLGTVRLFVDNLSTKAFLNVLLNLSFWLGLLFGLLARLVFVVINSQLSKLPITQNANTTLTFVVTLSSVIVVVLLNFWLLKEKLNFTQIVGAVVIILGILLILRNS